jgi:tRNA pseudouridine13 synthase
MYKIKQKPEDFIVEEIINLKLDERGNYSYFLLEKINLDTEQAIQNICKELNILRKNISYCGNKDKIAVTKQYISIQNLSKEKRKNYDFKFFNLKYIDQGNERLNLGSHDGNKFKIIVLSEKKPKIKNKILNLFGKQRFSNNNHLIGKEIIKNNFKEAINLMLKNDGNHERKIKEILEKEKNNYIVALRSVPKKIMNLYIHAYQSYLFNKIASQIKTEENIKLPLIGFGTEIKNNKIKTIVEDILKKEKISYRDFIIRQFPEISSEGTKRDLYLNLNDLKIKNKEKNIYEISFTLGKGSYATVVVDTLFN